MKNTFGTVLCVAALLASGCNKEKSLSGTGGACKDGSLPPEKVVATWTGGSLTAGDVEKDKEVKPQIDEAVKKLRELRKNAVEQIAVERLIDLEAKKKGVTKDQLIKTEIEDKVPAPPDEELQKTYADAAGSGKLPPGTKFEDVKPQIVSFLTQQAKADKTHEYVEGLRKQYGLKVDVPEPPVERVQVAATGPSRGPDSAKVTIVEFSDFECPFCGRAHDTVEQVMQDYAGKIKLVYRQFPLSFHPHAEKAAEAALCALDQNKFWEYHDQLFKNQKALEVADLKGYAKTVGLDSTKFDACVDGSSKKSAVETDQKAGGDVGVNGTPAFFINGIELSGAQPLDAFKKIIDAELAGKS